MLIYGGDLTPVVMSYRDTVVVDGENNMCVANECVSGTYTVYSS